VPLNRVVYFGCNKRETKKKSAPEFQRRSFSSVFLLLKHFLTRWMGWRTFRDT